eukprot:m.161560 g.161560  ORF g.161560 m.161560 type:complete len:2199 (+) comp17650_c2_seq2:156-6752(+)
MFTWRHADRYKASFQDERRTSQQRLQALRDYLQQDDVELATRRSFLSENMEVAFAVVQETFVRLYPELIRKASKRKPPTESQRVELYDCVVWTLEKMLDWNQAQFSTRWQFHSINQLVAALLARGNCASLRKAGIRILVKWMLSLKLHITASVLDRFGEAFGIITEKQPQQYAQALPSCLPLVPDHGDEEVDRSPDLLDYFMDCITKTVVAQREMGSRRASSSAAGAQEKAEDVQVMARSVSEVPQCADTTVFFFFLELLSHQYLPRLYSDLCKQMGVVAIETAQADPAEGLAPAPVPSAQSPAAEGAPVTQINTGAAVELALPEGFVPPTAGPDDGTQAQACTARHVRRQLHDVLVRWYLRWLSAPNHVLVRCGILRNNRQMGLAQGLFTLTLSGGCGQLLPAAGGGGGGDAKSASATPTPGSSPAPANSASDGSHVDEQNLELVRRILLLYKLWLSRPVVVAGEGAKHTAAATAAAAASSPTATASQRAFSPPISHRASDSFLNSAPPEPPQSQSDSAATSAEASACPSSASSPVQRRRSTYGSKSGAAAHAWPLPATPTTPTSPTTPTAPTTPTTPAGGRSRRTGLPPTARSLLRAFKTTSAMVNMADRLWVPHRAALGQLYRTIIDNTALTFTLLNTGAPRETTAVLCRDALCVLHMFATRATSRLDQRLVQHILETLLAVTEGALGSLSLLARHSVPDMSTQLLAGPLFEAILTLTTRMSLEPFVDTLAVWSATQSLLSRYTGSPDLISEWRRNVCLVTSYVAVSLCGSSPPSELRLLTDTGSSSSTASPSPALSVGDESDSPRTPTRRRRHLRHHPQPLRSKLAGTDTKEECSPSLRLREQRPRLGSGTRNRVGGLFSRAAETHSMSSSMALSEEEFDVGIDESSLSYSILNAEFRDIAPALLKHKEKLPHVWMSLIASLGDINAIDTPRNHAKAVAVLRLVFDALRPAVTPDPMQFWAPPFMSWLVEAAKRNDRFAEGRYLAYKACCDVVLEHRLEAPPPQHVLLPFYTLVLRGLRNGDRDVVYELLDKCYNMFALDLPGSTCLVLDFVSAIRSVLGHGIFPSTIRNASLQQTGCKFFRGVPKHRAITLLCSLVCFPAVYADLSLPTAFQLERVAPPDCFLLPQTNRSPEPGETTPGRSSMASVSGSTPMLATVERSASLDLDLSRPRSASLRSSSSVDLGVLTSPPTPVRRHTTGSTGNLCAESPSGVTSAPVSPIKGLAATFSPHHHSGSDPNLTLGSPSRSHDEGLASPDMLGGFAAVSRELAVALRGVLIEETSTFCRCMALNGLCMFAMSNLLSPEPELLVAQSLDSILAMLRFSDVRVAAVATSCISSLSNEQARLEFVAPGSVSKIIFMLNRALFYWLPDPADPMAQPCLGLPVLWCLRDWVLNAGQTTQYKQAVDVTMETLSRAMCDELKMEQHGSCLDRLCSSKRAANAVSGDLAAYTCNEIEAGLLQETIHGTSSGQSPSLSRRERKKGTPSLTRRTRPEVIPEVPEGDDRSHSFMGATSDVPFATYDEVILSIKTVLHHVRSSFGQARTAPWPARVDSMVTEADHLGPAATLDEVVSNAGVQFFAMGEHAIISVCELPSLVRVIVRDTTGKFAWDLDESQLPTAKSPVRAEPQVPDTDAADLFLPVPQLPETASTETVDSADSTTSSQSVSTADHATDTSSLLFAPLSEGCSSGQSDALAHVLDYLSGPQNKMPDPTSILELPASLAEADVQALTEPETVDKIGSLGLESPTALPKQSLLRRQQSLVFEASKPTGSSLSHLTRCRALLVQIGLNAWGGPDTLYPLPKTEKLVRELKNLDHRGAVREQHKIAVVYVGDGQDNKQAILANARGSPCFDEFVGGLGWGVTLEEHNGYNGNLKASQFPTSVLPYYATGTLEVLFHVSTAMIPAAIPVPAPPDRVQELFKARWVHIGNDDVHVVWNDHSKPFLPSVMPTQFAEVTIVINPMAHPSLFAVRIVLKRELPSLGPLFDGAVVDSRALPSLVRATAVNAGRLLRSGTQSHYETRRTYLSRIAFGMRDDPSFEEFAATLMAPRTTGPPPLGLRQRSRHRTTSTAAASSITDQPPSPSPTNQGDGDHAVLQTAAQRLPSAPSVPGLFPLPVGKSMSQPASPATSPLRRSQSAEPLSGDLDRAPASTPAAHTAQVNGSGCDVSPATSPGSDDSLGSGSSFVGSPGEPRVDFV